MRERIESPHEDYRATLFAIIHLVANVCAKAGCDRKTPVGVGIPGAISPSTKQVKNANSTWLIGHEIDKDLSEALGCPVRVANDANCFAVSEAVDGAAKGYGMVFGVILGTGVGGGIAIDGRTHAGLNADRAMGEDIEYQPQRDDLRRDPAEIAGADTGRYNQFDRRPVFAAEEIPDRQQPHAVQRPGEEHADQNQAQSRAKGIGNNAASALLSPSQAAEPFTSSAI